MGKESWHRRLGIGIGIGILRGRGIGISMGMGMSTTPDPRALAPDWRTRQHSRALGYNDTRPRMEHACDCVTGQPNFHRLNLSIVFCLSTALSRLSFFFLLLSSAPKPFGFHLSPTGQANSQSSAKRAACASNGSKRKDVKV